MEIYNQLRKIKHLFYKYPKIKGNFPEIQTFIGKNKLIRNFLEMRQETYRKQVHKLPIKHVHQGVCQNHHQDLCSFLKRRT